jgi:hypothetical protein
MKQMITLLSAKPHFGVLASIGSLPLSIVLAKLAAILGPLTVIGGFLIMILTLMIKWRDWKRGK